MEYFALPSEVNRDELHAVGKLKYDILNGDMDDRISVEGDIIYIFNGFDWDRVNEDFKKSIWECYKYRFE